MNTLSRHWPEYLMEAASLGIFMISAGLVTVILEHPASPIWQVIPDPLFRRFVIGVAMGLTAIAIIYSPWGKQSGAHINPAVTLTFFRLGIPLLSLSGKAISRSLISQSIQAILLEKLGGCICC